MLIANTPRKEARDNRSPKKTKNETGKYPPGES
jgi:hypothetical protein